MSKPILRAAVAEFCIGQKLGYKCQHMRWNLSEPAVFSVKSWDAVCFALLYAPETGRYGWLQCPFHFDASAEVRRTVKQCSDFVSNDQSSTCEGKMDIKTSLQQVQQVSCFLHFQTSKRPQPCIFSFFLTPWMPRFSKRKTSASRAESGSITFQAPQRERSHAILGEHEDILWTTVVLWKNVKTDSQSCSGWILHWTEVGLQVPTYEVEPVGTCRFLGQILRCGLFCFAVCARNRKVRLAAVSISFWRQRGGSAHCETMFRFCI